MVRCDVGFMTSGSMSRLAQFTWLWDRRFGNYIALAGRELPRLRQYFQNLSPGPEMFF